MKTIALLSILVLFSASACKKNYTCSCEITTESTKTSVPRTTGARIVETSKYSYTTLNTRPHISKTDMRRTTRCNSRIENAQSTYTAIVSFNDASTATADVTEINQSVYTCEIK